MKLEGKMAVVTGGGQGIGRAIAICLAEEGADVAVVDIKAETARIIADEVKKRGRRSLAVATDATDVAQVNRAVKEILEAFGQIDILVNNVGGESRFYKPRNGHTFIEIEQGEWDDNLDLNLKTTVIMSRAVVPHLIKQNRGKIVNISSVAGRSPGGGSSGKRSSELMSYAVAKAGVIRFTQGLALELAQFNINVNSVCPGIIYTPLLEENAKRNIQLNPEAKGMTPKEFFEKFMVPNIPLKRGQTPEDIGRAVVFFVSEDAKNITGQTLNVNGGSCMD